MFYVAVHLRDERLRAIETLLAAQALAEAQAQLAPVEVAVEVEQICLHQQAERRLEGRAQTDADGGRELSGVVADGRPAGVDPVGRHHLRSEERRVGKECRSRWSPYH